MKRLGALVFAVTLVATTALATVTIAADGSVDSFKPLDTFVVPGGGVAEILSATSDGNYVVYTNAGDGSAGIVDLSDPANPVEAGSVEVGGEPTSVSVVDDVALVVVKTSILEDEAPPVITPGLLLAIDIPSGEILGELEIGPGPDSIDTAVIDGQLYAVIAIENEPVIVDEAGNKIDEDAPGQDGDISEPGFVQVIAVDEDNLADSEIQDVTFEAAELESLGLLFPDDPQPEFVKIHDGKAAVTLQENNGVAIIDVADAETELIFSTGYVEDRPADLDDNDAIDFSQTYPADVADEPYAGARFPDAIAWSADGTTLYTADEGEMDYTGGRGWSAWSADGAFLFDDGGALEALAVLYGAYPDGRSDAKGIEVEGVTTGVYGEKEFLFVGSERGSFVAVYLLESDEEPSFVQFLPAGISPEGLLALPDRDLFLTSEEVSGTISINEGVSGIWRGSMERPVLRSPGSSKPWGALSGLTNDPNNALGFFTVPDDALPSSVYRIQVLPTGQGYIRDLVDVTLDGEQAAYDLEGIANDTSVLAPLPPAEGEEPPADGEEPSVTTEPGWWLAQEGNAAFGEEEYRPNLLIQIDATGAVLQEIPLPAEVDSPEGGLIRSNGFEGVAVSDDGTRVVAAIQRQFADDQENGGVWYARVAVYDLETAAWEFYLYPLDPTDVEEDWIGLSEITNIGDGQYAVIERDKQVGGLAHTKKIYTFSLDGVEPFDGVVAADADLGGSVIEKTELTDVLEEFMPFEKVEGLALSTDGDLWALLDNDGGGLITVMVDLGALSGLE